MEEHDPYAAPESQILVDASLGNERFRELDSKRFKKLYYRSQNVTSITGLLIISLLVMAAMVVFEEDIEYSLERNLVPRGLYLALIALCLPTVVGLVPRSAWGRIMGIFVCFIALFDIPIGTAIGAAGLFAFFKAPELFGPNRVTHAELKAEFKLRKKNGLL